MGADRIYHDHPPKRRRPRLIHHVDPELRRLLRKDIKRLPADLQNWLSTAAEESGVSVDSIMCYALSLHVLGRPLAEQLKMFRKMYPGADDAEIEHGLAELKRNVDAEIDANRKRMKP